MTGTGNRDAKTAAPDGRIVGSLGRGHDDLARLAPRRNVPLHRLAEPAPEQGAVVEALTSRGGDRVIGYRYVGAKPGPCVMVAGFNPTASAVFERLLRLPTLPWLRGTLYMMMPDALDQIDAEAVRGFVPHAQVDEVMFLPDAGGAELQHAEVARTGYWMLLRLCARLGMIDGRGVNAHP